MKIEKKVHKLLKGQNSIKPQNSNLYNEHPNWISSDFEYLSILIHNHTKNEISGSTLQRMFGKKDTQKEYILKKKTKSIIALFLGYPTWEAMERYLIDMIIENINLDEVLREQISQTLCKKMP